MLIFVAGIHGAGKTSTLTPVCEELKITHVSASELIKKQLGYANWTSSRIVGNFDKNQIALLAAVRNLQETTKEIVIDGHFVLRHSIDVHEPIDAKVFTELMPTGTIIIEETPDVVINRLKERDSTTWRKDEVVTFAEKELMQAQHICKNLNIPLIRLRSPSKTDVLKAVSSFRKII